MRRTAAVLAAKAAAFASRRLRAGGGTALPGLIAEKVDPGLVRGLSSQLGQGSILITGTNGKTTTARLVRSVVAAAGLRPVANSEGSNMMRGVAAALAEAATWEGRLSRRKKRIGVFEVDEATLPLVATAVRPRVVVFSNLFRDQLDRYGEVETVAALWRKTVAELPDDVTLCLNADDPAVASLRDSATGRVVLYGLDDVSQAAGPIEHAADARWCPRCCAELSHTAVFYGHIGHWRCDSCGYARPAPDVACVRVGVNEGGVVAEIRTPSSVVQARLALQGVYNVYNALATAAAGVALGLDDSRIEKGLASVTAAFGRQERLVVRGRDVQLILAKNPAGLNQVLRGLTSDDDQKNIALFLNDRLADGRDISWIWDADFERLTGHVGTLTVSGIRAWDMALRVKYAGIAESPRVIESTAGALAEAIERTPEGETLYVIPTYTAMLEARNILGKWAGRGAFWENQ